MVRVQTALLLQPHAKKGRRIDPRKLIPFPGEIKPATDPERFKKAMQFFNRPTIKTEQINGKTRSILRS